jgi:WD40 repeat protein
MTQRELIFISYARRDGAALARRLKADLESNGFDAWLDTSEISGGAVWSLEIERELDHRQVTIALLSPGSYASEICRAEQLRALDKGNRVLPVLAVKGADLPIYLYIRQYLDFTSEEEYAARFQELLNCLKSGETATLPERYRTTPVKFITAPPQVANYVDRPDAVAALRNSLFAEDHRAPIALTALAGMGGIGKTVLAKALTDDPVVRRAFPDGIVWITAGRERKRDFLADMSEIARVAGEDLDRCRDNQKREQTYRALLAGRAMLIVVDDVWSTADVEPLLAESTRSRFLFTTRDQSIGRFVGAHEHRAELLESAQARDLLARWAGVQAAALPPIADALVAECGRLPLALAVIGALLRGAEPEFWPDTLDLLKNADISAIEDQLPLGQASFFRAIEVSFRALRPELQERYRKLAILLEDTPAPLAVLQTLWGASESEARRIARQFADRSLAQQEGEGLLLHDLQLDYIRTQHPDREALTLIHGAWRLSAHVIARDPKQFASQIVGRLLPHEEKPAISSFVDQIARDAPRPWLRSLHPALQPPGGPLIRTLEGHSDGVTAVALLPDGRRALSASWDGTLKLWDLETGQILTTLEGHSGWVSAVALLPDGRRALSTSSDKTLKLWDLETGQVIKTLEGHSECVTAVAMLPDGRRALSASGDYTLKLWDLDTGKVLKTLEGHSGWVSAVALLPDGRRALSSSFDKTLRLWDIETGQVLKTLEGHSGPVTAVALLPDGRRALSASGDNTLKLWDFETGLVLKTLEGHSREVTAVALLPDGRHALSASGDKTLTLWDLEAGQLLKTLEGHSREVNAVSLLPGGRRALSGSWDNTLKLWDLEAGKLLKTLEGHSREVTAVALLPDGRHALSASGDKTLKLWDLEASQLLKTLEGHSREVTAVSLLPGGRRALSGSWDNTLKLWDLETGQILTTLEGHSGWVSAVALLPDGRRALSASSDKTLKLWDIETGLVLKTLEGHSECVTAVALLSDGRRALSASRDMTLKLWNFETGQILKTLEGHSDWVWAVVLLPDSRRALSASDDKTLKLWDLETGQVLKTLEGHSREVRAVALLPDSRRALSASDDKTLKLWDLETGVQVAAFTCDAAARCCACIDDRRLVAGDQLGRLHWLALVE